MENTKFKVKCGLHKDETIKFIDISLQPNSNKQITFCDQCLTERNSKGQLFKIKNIISNKQIENWPYLGDSLNQSQVNELKQGIDEIQQNVINQCSEFKNKIIKIIDSYQKQIISILSDLYVEIESQSQENDNKIDQFSKLLLNTKTSDDLVQQLKALISSIQQDQNSNNPIQSTLKRVKESKKIPEQINKTQDVILNQINQSLKISIEKMNSCLKNNISIMEQLKMKATPLYGGQHNITIENNEQDIVVQINAQHVRCQAVSEYIFDKTKKYLIRIQIEGSAQDKYPMIGLIRSNLVQSRFVYEDNLCYYTNGLIKGLKGGKLFHTFPQEIEFFISFPENKMLVADYPNYNNINTLEDNNYYLMEYQNLCLGFTQGHKCDLKYIIKECNIISDNPKWVL